MLPYRDDRPGGRNYFEDPLDRPTQHRQRPQEVALPPMERTRASRHDRSRFAFPDQQPDAYPKSRSTRAPNVRIQSPDDLYARDYTRARRRRDPFDAEPLSRHDLEYKTSDHDRNFREKRGGYTAEEGAALRRAKSSSPSRAAHRPEKETRSRGYDDDDVYDGYRHAEHAFKSPQPSGIRTRDYLDDSDPPRRKSPSGHHGRQKSSAGSDAYSRYDDDLQYKSQNTDRRPYPYTYGGIGQPPHSHGPRNRSWDDGYYSPGQPYRDDYGPARPEDDYKGRTRRGTSVDGRGLDRDGRMGGRRHPTSYYDGRYPQSKDTSSKGKSRDKGKRDKAAGMFMTHAMPAIKQNAVPLLLQGAQAYLKQKGG